MARTDEEIYSQHFIALVTSFYDSAMQQMGKLINPLSGQIEKNLKGAKATIDVLRMLKAKTEGNLKKDEQDLIANCLTNLQMNYVDEIKREGQETEKAEEKGKEENKKSKEDKS